MDLLISKYGKMKGNVSSTRMMSSGTKKTASLTC